MAFNLPTGLYTLPKQGATWSRPTDWPVTTDATNEAQFLFADIGDACLSMVVSASASAGGTFSIDWGDGSTSTGFSAGSEIRTNHTYVKGTGATCSRGYTTFKIRVYGTTGINFTAVRPRPLTTRLNPFQEVAILEAYYGDSLTEVVFNGLFQAGGSFNGGGYFSYLEYFKMPTTTSLTSASYFAMCNQCTSLKVIIMPTSSPGATDFSQAFNNCPSLLSVTFPSDSNPTTMNSVFINCASLKSVVLPTTMSNCTNMGSAFSQCFSLQNIILPALPACVDFNSTFSNCVSLTSVKILGLYTGSATTIGATNWFQNCSRLESLTWPTSVSSLSPYNLANAFTTCASLRTFVAPPGMTYTSMSSMFNACYSLQTVDITGNGTMSASFTNMTSTFQNCNNLTSVTLPYATTSTTGTLLMSLTFTACQSLETIVIPNGLGPSISQFTLTFNTNQSLKSLVLPTTMNNCTVINITPNANTIENLVLPTSATSCTNFTLNNTILKSLTLPTLSSALTTFSLHNNGVLSTISNMPTLSAITSFTNNFGNCYSLKSITLPTCSASLTSYSNAFINCHSLESITFPTTQVTATSGSFANMFQNCASLKTLINFNKIQTTSATPVISADTNNNMLLVPGLTFSTKLSKLNLSGAVTTTQNQLTSLRLTNVGTGQWTGTTPQINISYTNITYANLVILFNDIAASGTYSAKTINITGCAGAASLTAADRLILTSRGWTITG